VSRPLTRVFAYWRTGLSGPVIVLQVGTAVSYFGTGLILPFEIIYLHEVRGFTTGTAGLVLAAVMGTAAVVTLPAGALLDRFRAKPIVMTGNLVSALGYGGLAFVDRPWQGFVCSAVGGAGFAVAGTANQVLSLTLVTPEQRAASIALRRVAGNFGMGAGATVAGFIVASSAHLRTFQALYLFDAATFAVFALVVLMGIPNPRPANAASASGRPSGFRAVARDRLLLALIAANVVLVMVGGAFFSNCEGAHARRSWRDWGRLLHQHLLHRRCAGSRHTGRQAHAPHTRLGRDQRAVRGRPTRGAARDIDALDARRYHRLGRGRNRDCDR
jgi:MFS family permease